MNSPLAKMSVQLITKVTAIPQRAIAAVGATISMDRAALDLPTRIGKRQRAIKLARPNIMSAGPV
jgi:hypothetical protein